MLVWRVIYIYTDSTYKKVTSFVNCLELRFTIYRMKIFTWFSIFHRINQSTLAIFHLGKHCNYNFSSPKSFVLVRIYDSKEVFFCPTSKDRSKWRLQFVVSQINPFLFISDELVYDPVFLLFIPCVLIEDFSYRRLHDNCVVILHHHKNNHKPQFPNIGWISTSLLSWCSTWYCWRLEAESWKEHLERQCDWSVPYLHICMKILWEHNVKI